ncbi:M48 family metallopeptidase [Variovorax sp. Sphag1AA]|uniref:M48 family metallopeptidase n=1 Tax=Variovorax sp. Sphag1AA TaxID=2587027 RepID=UPI001614A9FF|nr:M48 family metallopeptidase [Variovorax sp. Sphag1AA]MBB3180518.1 Zn-dependent protease with chaperone function [Variovorax sp. Sphag1AA]
MTTLEVRFFDGQSSRPHAARLRMEDDVLTVEPLAGEHFAPIAVPTRQIRWPERTRHGGRIAQLPNGATVQAIDVPAWDAWTAQLGHRESWVVRAQQNWRGVLVAFVLVIVAGAAMYQWALPWAARGITAMVPQRVDALIGSQVLESLDDSLLLPSELPLADQERIRHAFARMVQAAHPDDAPPWQLEFRRGRDKRLGPNALALPGGTIVLTDELVRLMPGNDDAIVGVLGHEFGHVRLRHAMRQLVQVSAVGLAVSAAFGDYGTLITSAPVLLATLGYSRDAEREADAESLRLMRSAGIPPRAMADFFEAIEQWRQTRPSGEKDDVDFIGLAFSTHPATAERIAFFRDATVD